MSFTENKETHGSSSEKVNRPAVALATARLFDSWSVHLLGVHGGNAVLHINKGSVTKIRAP